MSARKSRGVGAMLVCAMACSTISPLALRTIRKQRYLRRRRKRSWRPAKYRQKALLRPVKSEQSTLWNQILSCGVDDDFLVSTNFTEDTSINSLVPLFEVQRTWLQPRPSNWPRDTLLAL